MVSSHRKEVVDDDLEQMHVPQTHRACALHYIFSSVFSFPLPFFKVVGRLHQQRCGRSPRSKECKPRNRPDSIANALL